MRKNIYNDNIMMISFEEYYRVAASDLISTEEINLLKIYLNQMSDKRFKYSKDINKNSKKEMFGFYKEDEIVSILKRVIDASYKYERMELKNMSAAVIYSLVHDEENPKLIDAIKTWDLTRKVTEFIEVYGRDTFEYIEAHKDFWPPVDREHVDTKDREIYLCHEGKVTEEFIQSKNNVLTNKY